jgi:hypothetical protein
MPTSTRAARVAVLLLGAAAASLAALEAGRRLSDLSVADVQELLEQHNLAPFMAKEFKEFLVDGEALSVLRADTLAREDFPKAKGFHWDKFFALLTSLRHRGNDAASSGDAEPEQRRNLASSAGSSAIHIKRDAAALIMGAEGDVSLVRTGDGELSLQGRLLLADSAGAMVDVAERLEALLAAAEAADADTRVDTLIEMVALNTEMVALNTELLMNVSASCAAVTASEPEVPLYTCKDALLLEAPSGRFATEDYGHVCVYAFCCARPFIQSVHSLIHAFICAERSCSFPTLGFLTPRTHKNEHLLANTCASLFA